ncbi:hypothetical protein D3C72_2248310 [compost metagenome]
MGIQAAHHITATVQVQQHRPRLRASDLGQIEAQRQAGAVAGTNRQLAACHLLGLGPSPDQPSGSLLEGLAGQFRRQGVQRWTAGQPPLLHQVEESAQFRMQ